MNCMVVRGNLRVEEVIDCVRYGHHDALQCLQAGENSDNLEAMHPHRYANTGTKTRAGEQTHQQARIHGNPMHSASTTSGRTERQACMHEMHLHQLGES
jgi:hypothetical protein